mmetsp:Transcript_26696/g.69211  ORF Transcript_26696/g.69211 Transcript_26696/m.69211 type:complete len:191 (+) Transcript_26696:133-705(+)|eukprot:jgi/Tetstr1/422872/TSEL_013663.t1
MAEEGGGAVPEPLVVSYCPVTGVPAEFNEYLPSDCAEHKKWAAAVAAGGTEGGMAGLSLADGPPPPAAGEAVEKKLPGGKTKKKAKAEVVIERNVRNKKKSITTVSGLDVFGVKLAEAAKLFGKKFASGASVVKTASGGEEVDVQGDCLDKLPDFILKSFKDKDITKAPIFFMDGKSKKPFYGAEEEAEA